MKKSDLKIGNCIATRHKKEYVFTGEHFCSIKSGTSMPLTDFKDNLLDINDKAFDIMEVYDGYGGNLLWKRNETTTIELTMQEIADKFGIDVKELRIKDGV